MNETSPAPLFNLLGVKLPAWLPAFDCRWAEDLPLPKDASGLTLYGSERAEVALGLRDTEKGIYNSVTPTSIQGTDFRDPRWQKDAAKTLRDLIKYAKKHKAVYDSLGENWKDTDRSGGVGYFLPVAIALSNFGASLICDRRAYRVKFFQD